MYNRRGRHMKSVRKENFIFIFLLVFMVLCFLANHFTTDNMYNPALEHGNTTINPIMVEAVDDATDIFHLKLESVDENNNTLLFYTNHQEVYAYIDDEMIYSLEKADSIFGRTPGAMWNIITLPTDTDEIQIKISQVYPDLAKQKVEFELGSALYMYRNIMNIAPFEIILTSAIIIIGFILFGYWILLFRKVNIQRELLYLALFAIIFGIWNFGETQFAVFMFNNRAFWSYLAFTCLMTMCLPAVFFFREFLETKDKYIYKIIVAYIVSETIICQTLHLTGLVGVKQTAIFGMVSIVLVLAYLLFAIISGIKRRKNTQKIVVNIIGLILLVITAVIDMSSYFTNILSANKAAKIGFLVYVILLGIETSRAARERLQVEQKMELIKEMAVKDILTGCYNRNSYNKDVGDYNNLTGVQIIGFDLNDLKKCNDTKGHMAGDMYIINAANMICEIYGEFGKVYRIGGDEFCVITKNISEEQLAAKKEQLKVAIAHYILNHPDSGFGIACGYATYDPKLDMDIEGIRHRADLLMYENKKIIKSNMITE